MPSALPSTEILFRGNVVLPDRILSHGAVLVREGRIVEVGPSEAVQPAARADVRCIDGGDGFIAPGYIDLHCHGGAGADFMDGTPDAFGVVLAAHARHGTTSICPTTTVARHEQILAMLDLCRQFKTEPAENGARVLGAHFYGPYFNYDARGCHCGDSIRPPTPDEFSRYLEYADAMTTATVAPELPGAEAFVQACIERGVGVNAGHTHATFDEMSAAVEWGVRHVDHLYCAMSDKSKLRMSQPYPMRGGVLEATFYFDELTTEVIADGKHLTADLLLLALKIKGPDRLALATDCNRALDMPEGQYVFGPLDGGEIIVHRDGVGIMPDGKALASSVRGMDFMVRTFAELTGRPVWEVIRMASLTPARIAGYDQQVGSLAPGKHADVLVLDRALNLQQVFIGGKEVAST